MYCILLNTYIVLVVNEDERLLGSQTNSRTACRDLIVTKSEPQNDGEPGSDTVVCDRMLQQVVTGENTVGTNNYHYDTPTTLRTRLWSSGIPYDLTTIFGSGLTKQEILGKINDIRTIVSVSNYPDILAKTIAFTRKYSRNIGVIYSLFDENGSFLYIGQTIRPLQRITTHLNDASWICEAKDITFEILEDTPERLTKESLLIYRHQPKYNIARKGNRV